MSENSSADTVVYAGIDTHKDFHVVAVIDHLGRLLDTFTAATTVTGYKTLLHWFSSIGLVIRIGVEGTGSYGVAVTAVLRSQGFEVIEVNRPNRQIRRLRGKTDSIDAEAAARSVLSGTATNVALGSDIASGCASAMPLSGVRG